MKRKSSSDPERRDRVHDERVDRPAGRRRATGRGTGSARRRPTHSAEERARSCSAPGTSADDAEQPHADARARADDQREEQLAPHVADERALDPRRSAAARRAAGSAGRSRRRAAACRAACRSRSRRSGQAKRSCDDRDRGALGELRSPFACSSDVASPQSGRRVVSPALRIWTARGGGCRARPGAGRRRARRRSGRSVRSRSVK